MGKLRRYRAFVLADGHAVVIQDDDEVSDILMTGKIVDGLIGDPVFNRGIPDKGDGEAIVLPIGILGYRHADGRGNAISAVPVGIPVKVGFLPQIEGSDTIGLSYRSDVSSGKDLIGVGLVADIKEDVVPIRREVPQQGYRQFDDTEVAG